MRQERQEQDRQRFHVDEQKSERVDFNIFSPFSPDPPECFLLGS